MKRWARAWIIDNGGHRTGKKNMVTADFNKPRHEHLGFDWDPLNKTISICDAAARACMKSNEVGAIWQDSKQGTTHNDTHGKEHVAQGQVLAMAW